MVSFYIHALRASGKAKNRFNSKLGFDRGFLYFDLPDALRVCFFLKWDIEKKNIHFMYLCVIY